MRKHLPVILSAFLLCSCAHYSKTSALHYSAPSAAPVREKITSAKSSVDSAIAIAKELKNAKLELNVRAEMIDSLTALLLSAKGDLSTAESRVSELQSQVSVVTDGANRALKEKNDAIGERDAARSERDEIKERANELAGQRNKLLLALVGAGLWIFRGPLLSAAGFIVRKFAGLP